MESLRSAFKFEILYRFSDCKLDRNAAEYDVSYNKCKCKMYKLEHHNRAVYSSSRRCSEINT